MVSPYGLIWNSENYYLVAFDHTHRELRHYRVDKMTEIVVTGMEREGRERWSWPAWWTLAKPSSLWIKASLFFCVMKREDCTASMSSLISGSSKSRSPMNQPEFFPFRHCTSRPNWRRASRSS